MSKLSCWHIEEAAEYVTPGNEKGPAYVFIFEYKDKDQEDHALAQFVSEKILTSVGSQCFTAVLHRIKDESGFINVSQEDVVEAFGLCRPFHEYGADNVK